MSAKHQTTASVDAWHDLKKIFWPLLVADHRTWHGVISQTNKLTPEQKRVLDAPQVKPRKRYLALPTPKHRYKA